MEIAVYTDGSVAPTNPGPGAYGFYAFDNNKCYHGFGGVGILVTNNYCELKAILVALTTFIENFPELKKLTLISDSKYALDGINFLDSWEKRKWIGSTGNPIANVEIWKEIQGVIKRYNVSKIELKKEWVKGHSGVEGNVNADKNANKGRECLASHDLEQHFEVSEISTSPQRIEVIVDVDKKEKVVHADKINPLMFGKRWFFFTNVEGTISDKSFYLTSNYKDDKVLKNQNFGKHSADTSYGIVISDNTIEELDTLRNKFNDRFGIETLPILIYLNTLLKPVIWDEVSKSKNKFTEIKGSIAIHTDGQLLGQVCNPPKLVFKTREIYGFGFNLIEMYRTKSIDIVDITECFIVKKKDKFLLNPNFTGSDKLMIIKDVKVSEKITTNINLNIGIDLPQRNNFLSLSKIANDIKISLLLWDICDNSLKVAIIIETDKGLGLYFTPDANHKLITKVK